MRERLLCPSPGYGKLLPIFLLLSWFPLAEASQIRSLNLQQMSLKADRVFAGRCLDVRVDEDPGLGQPVTTVTLAVTRSVKGGARGQVSIRMLGRQDGRDPEGGEIGGLPRFAPGEEVVLFLYGDSARGLTSPVGFGQGKFAIHTDKQGKRLAVNAFANRRLLEGLEPGAERRLGSSLSRWKGRADVPEDDLLDMVRALLEEARP